MSLPSLIELDWLKQWDLYSPEKIAFKEYNGARVVTYRQFYRGSVQLSGALASRFGIGKGDRVVVLSRNTLEFPFLFFALQRLGAILVPVNFRLTASEIGHILSDCEPKLVLLGQGFEGHVKGWPTLPLNGPASLATMIQTDDPPPISAPFAGGWKDPCMILYTSGTTGFPKGALITQEMIFWNSVNTTLRLDLRQSDVTLGFLPFFHTGAWNVLALPLFHRGGTVVFLEKFEPEFVLRACTDEKVTILFGVPTTMDLMARSTGFEGVDLRSVRYAIVGGEAMREELILTWQDKGVPIRQGFGLTEFGPNVFSLSEHDSLRKIGSIGFPNFYIQAKLVDMNGSEVEGPGMGELALQGPVCTPGYWNNPSATAEAIRDNWFYTGDLLRRDAEGYYYVVGRKKDMYISGAENVYPAEIERVILEHPLIREAAVIGVPDSKWGEVGKAFVVKEDGAVLTASELLSLCRERMAGYKVPKYFEFLESLPKTESGKVLKAALRVL